MKKQKISIVFILLLAFFSFSTAQESKKIEVLLNKSMLLDANLSTKFIPSIDYTTAGFIALASTNETYLLGVGGLVKFFPNQEKIGSFTITHDGYFLAICGNKLFQINKDGKFNELLELPNENMQVAAGNNAFYVFGKEKNSMNHAIYIILRNNTYSKLISVKTPINAVLEYEQNILFASENKIIGINAETKKIFELISLSNKQEKIRSIAFDNEQISLYFSTDKAIYQIQKNKPQCISNEFSGLLRFDGEGLIVFNPENSFIVKFLFGFLHPESTNK